MNIFYTASFHLTEKASGISRYVVDVAEQMSKLGHNVVVATYGDTTNIKQVGDVTYFEIESFHIPPVRMALLSKKNVRAIDDFLKDFKPDIIHVNLFSQIDFYVANWAKQNGIPVTYTIHLIPSALMSFGKLSKRMQRLMNSKLMLKLLSNLYKGFDFLIAPNEIAKRDAEVNWITNPIYVVNNGYNGEILHRQRKYDSTQKKKLLYVGGGHPRKNQIFLIKALKYLDNSYELNLIGLFYDSDYHKLIKEYLAKNSLKNVNFLGLIKHDDVIDEMFKNDIFVSASKIEVQSLVILESLATGLPIVALSNETTSELINDSNGKCLKQDISPKLFANEIQKISKLSIDKYELMSNNARNTVKNMTWEVSTKKLEQIYLNHIQQYKLNKSFSLKTLSWVYVIMSRILKVGR